MNINEPYSVSLRPPPQAMNALGPSDLQNAADMYNQVKELRLRLTNVQEDVLERYLIQIRLIKLFN